MKTVPDPEPQESVDLQLAGVPVKLRGREIVLVLIIVLLLGMVGWLGLFSLSKWGNPFDLQIAFTQHQNDMNNQHTNYVNGVSELTFVMSVCLNKARQQECEKLRFDMPDSLRMRIRD